MQHRVTGTTSGDLVVTKTAGIVHARGIPYATAERFHRPQPIDTPGCERDATRRGPACLQFPSRLDSLTGTTVHELEQSEDCLVVTVTTPSEAHALPVMVWLHGGGYVCGGGEAAMYDADLLVREGVIVVTVTSRLGGFGYLTPKGLGEDNVGVRDQIEALRWVSANIAHFGGDPHNVTLFGQSAGADSILTLMACESTEGLFGRVIVQSAPLGLRAGRDAVYTAARAAFAAHFTDDPLTVPASEVLKAERAVTRAVRRFGPAGGMPFGPISRQDPISADPVATLLKRAGRVEMLIGHTKDDASPFVDIVMNALWLNRFGPLSGLYTAPIVKVATRLIFGVDGMVALWHHAGGRVGKYRVDWAPKRSPLGACHCIELPMLFGDAWTGAPMLAGEAPPERLSSAIRRTWTDFAKGGVARLPAQALVFDART
jgi:para-nitrobenzyl esterase